MNTLLSITIGLFSGIGIWLISAGFGASNPSLNGIVYGGFLAVIVVLADILEEIRSQKPK